MRWINKKKDPRDNYHENKIYYRHFSELVSFGLVNNRGHITETGYKLYISILTILGVDNILKGPLRKTKVLFVSLDELKHKDIIVYNEIKMRYELGSNGKDTLQVLIQCIKKNGIPRLV